MEKKCMFNIKYSKEAFLSVDKFIVYLKKYYKNIYFDTWIINEDQIVTNYVLKTEELFDEIINVIESTINKKVFWEITYKNNNKTESRLVVKVRSYIIVVILEKQDLDIDVKNITIT